LSSLRELNCIPCRGDVPPLSESQITELHLEVPAWRIKFKDNIPRLERTFKFKDFAQALEFTNRVGAIAEAEDHHPALLTQWGSVTISWWTHVIKGLHRNDFIMAAKTDALYGN
jgi:4a-hydroxytetrahydrobiopterin dehydratase